MCFVGLLQSKVVIILFKKRRRWLISGLLILCFESAPLGFLLLHRTLGFCFLLFLLSSTQFEILEFPSSRVLRVLLFDRLLVLKHTLRPTLWRALLQIRIFKDGARQTRMSVVEGEDKVENTTPIRGIIAIGGIHSLNGPLEPETLTYSPTLVSI